MAAKGFENVKNQIGYCGIWCGSCSGGNGAILELARRLEQALKGSNPDYWVPKEMNFEEFMKALGIIQTASLCLGCQKGGGNPTCNIRACASKRNIANCSQCNELMECKNFEELERYYPRIREGLLKIKEVGREESIRKWMNELKTKWPHCILLCEATKQ